MKVTNKLKPFSVDTCFGRLAGIALHRAPGALLTAVLLLAPVVLPVRAQPQKMVDQILVLVDRDIITRIDLIWNLALNPNEPSPAGPVSSDVLARELDIAIEQRLIIHEAARLPSAELTQEEVDKKRAELIALFRSEAEFRQRLESVGLTPEKLDELLRQRIAIERFIDFRFRSFVFVTEPDIQRYYEQKIVPPIREKGAVPPSLDAELPGEKMTVRDKISMILRAEKIEQETTRWLKDASQRADIVKLAEP
ncbi:MAG TPA: hypothetical protein VG778_01225 [Blastocatellia bacterium]|nr:hypothetical protein [Blastocatellia bacterium]